MYNANPYLGTMPYGVQPYTNYGQNYGIFQPQQTQPQNGQNTPQTTTNTNKIYVSGIDDARNRPLAPNSDYIFLDNDKAILYQKIVSGNGQFEVKAFTITPYEPNTDTKPVQSIDLSDYVKTADLDPFKSELEALKSENKTLKEQFAKLKQGGATNGTSQSSGTTRSDGTRPQAQSV